MQLTYVQIDYIAKQYTKYLQKKIPLKKCNENLQKYFNTDIDFVKTIVECEYFNTGSSAIGWLLYDHA